MELFIYFIYNKKRVEGGGDGGEAGLDLLGCHHGWVSSGIIIIFCVRDKQSGGPYKSRK